MNRVTLHPNDFLDHFFTWGQVVGFSGGRVFEKYRLGPFEYVALRPSWTRKEELEFKVNARSYEQRRLAAAGSLAIRVPHGDDCCHHAFQSHPNPPSPASTFVAENPQCRPTQIAHQTRHHLSGETPVQFGVAMVQ